MLKRQAIALIRWYQRNLSPDHGTLRVYFPAGYCKYDPTCSQYTLQAIEKNGLVKGGALGFWRIMRCNPWSSGGHDPVE